MKRALYCPGPSYFDDGVKAAAGWWAILEYQREAISMAGFEVEVATPDSVVYQSSPPIAKYISYGLPYVDRARAGDFDLIVGAPAYGLMPLISASQKTKRVSTVWNNSSAWRRAQLQEEYEFFGRPYPEDETAEMINTVALRSCDRVIACSPWVKKTHEAIGGLPQIDIAEWGVDSALFHPYHTQWGGNDPEATLLYVLFVGGDPIRKGLPYLFSALDKLEGVHLTIVGCDVQPPPAVANKVTVLGPKPFIEMPGEYQRHQVLVLPTLEDGVALCVQEAMACGLVPVTSPDAGEVFEHRSEGFVVGFRDIGGIESALTLLRDHPDQRRQMAANARKKAESQTWDAFKVKFAAIIEDVMQ